MNTLYAEEEKAKPLRIAVFCSADDKIPTPFKTLAHELGHHIAQAKWELVTGGSKTGLMKEVVDGYTKEPHHNVKGVLPKIFKDANVHHPKIKDKNLVWTDTVHTRLATFHDQCDVIIALPGGFGTLHELMDFLVHNQFGLIKKKIILLNVDHYWDGLVQQFQTMLKQSALHQKHLDHLHVATNLDECINLIKTSNSKELMQGFKNRYWEE